MSDGPITKRMCRTCDRVLPLSEFRRRARESDKRMNRCRACHNRMERERRAKHREKRLQREMGASLTKIKNESSDKKLRLLTAFMLDQYGGLQGFASAWRNHFEESMRIGGFPAFRCLDAATRLILFCDDNRPKSEQQPATAEMSNDELRAELASHVARLIERTPEIAIRAAEHLGWTVIPPKNDEPNAFRSVHPVD